MSVPPLLSCIFRAMRVPETHVSQKTLSYMVYHCPDRQIIKLVEAIRAFYNEAKDRDVEESGYWPYPLVNTTLARLGIRFDVERASSNATLNACVVALEGGEPPVIQRSEILIAEQTDSHTGASLRCVLRTMASLLTAVAGRQFRLTVDDVTTIMRTAPLRKGESFDARVDDILLQMSGMYVSRFEEFLDMVRELTRSENYPTYRGIVVHNDCRAESIAMLNSQIASDYLHVVPVDEDWLVPVWLRQHQGRPWVWFIYAGDHCENTDNQMWSARIASVLRTYDYLPVGVLRLPELSGDLPCGHVTMISNEGQTDITFGTAEDEDEFPDCVYLACPSCSFLAVSPFRGRDEDALLDDKFVCAELNAYCVHCQDEAAEGPKNVEALVVASSARGVRGFNFGFVKEKHLEANGEPWAIYAYFDEKGRLVKWPRYHMSLQHSRAFWYKWFTAENAAADAQESILGKPKDLIESLFMKTIDEAGFFGREVLLHDVGDEYKLENDSQRAFLAAALSQARHLDQGVVLMGYSYQGHVADEFPNRTPLVLGVTSASELPHD